MVPPSIALRILISSKSPFFPFKLFATPLSNLKRKENPPPTLPLPFSTHFPKALTHSESIATNATAISLNAIAMTAKKRKKRKRNTKKRNTKKRKKCIYVLIVVAISSCAIASFRKKKKKESSIAMYANGSCTINHIRPFAHSNTINASAMSLLPVAGALNALTPMNAIATVVLIARRQNAHALTHPLPKKLQNGK